MNWFTLGGKTNRIRQGTPHQIPDHAGLTHKQLGAHENHCIIFVWLNWFYTPMPHPPRPEKKKKKKPALKTLKGMGISKVAGVLRRLHSIYNKSPRW